MKRLGALIIGIICCLSTGSVLAWDCSDPAIDCNTLIVSREATAVGIASFAGAGAFQSRYTSILKLKNDQDADATIAELQATDGVHYVEPALLTQLEVSVSAPIADEDAIAPNDPHYSEQSHFNGTWGESLGIHEAWSSVTSTPVIIAVIDSGIDYRHEDLRDNMWVNADEIPDNGIDDDSNGYTDDVYGYNFYDDDSDPEDAHMHGTHIAGIIGATGNNDLGVSGLLWETQIMALRFTDSEGVGDTAKAIEAIHYAVSNGAEVINLSWTIQANANSQGSQALKDAISDYSAQGIIFAAASGNGDLFFNGYDIDSAPVYPAAINSDNLISVAASDSDGALAAYSNYGTSTVHVMAPGTSILSTLPGNDYGHMTGTSQATAFASAAAAILLTNDPSLSAADVKERIIDGANYNSDLYFYLSSGGSLNIHNALTGVVTDKPVPSSNPSSSQESSGDSFGAAEFASNGACSLGGTARQAALPYLLFMLLPAGVLFSIRNRRD